MKRLFILFCSLVLLYFPALAQAGPKEDYEEAYKIYLAAGASAAAYNDRIGELATRYLEQSGWDTDYYVQSQDQAGARFVLAKKETGQGGTLYVLAIVGTENADDIRIDLKVDKVYFAGDSLESFAVNAAKKDIPDTEPKVHRGFNEFIHTGPAANLRNANDTPLSLPDVLKNNKDNKLYITGHSLGGAAATIAGARLLSMGVNPEQIEVITFGAPAVGNAAFAKKFAPTLKLTRIVISGDPVSGVLQTLVGGYHQFGHKIKWSLPASADDPHRLPLYLDLAIKNYYDKRQQAFPTGFWLVNPHAENQVTQNRVYIAPLTNSLPHSLQRDFRYMREALEDEYRQTLPNPVIADVPDSSDWQSLAAAGFRWIIVPEVSGIKLAKEKNTYYITLTQTVYDTATGAVVDTAVFSTGTYNITPLEAFIHAFKGVSSHQKDWLEKPVEKEKGLSSLTN